MNLFQWLTKRSIAKEVINAFKMNLRPMQPTYISQIKSRLHLLKAKLLAFSNYFLKFNRLAIVGKLDGWAFKQYDYNVPIGYVFALLYLYSDPGLRFFVHPVVDVSVVSTLIYHVLTRYFEK